MHAHLLNSPFESRSMQPSTAPLPVSSLPQMLAGVARVRPRPLQHHVLHSHPVAAVDACIHLARTCDWLTPDICPMEHVLCLATLYTPGHEFAARRLMQSVVAPGCNVPGPLAASISHTLEASVLHPTRCSASAAAAGEWTVGAAHRPSSLVTPRMTHDATA